MPDIDVVRTICAIRVICLLDCTIVVLNNIKHLSQKNHLPSYLRKSNIFTLSSAESLRRPGWVSCH